MIVYVPFFQRQRSFHTFGMDIIDWVIVVLLAGTVIPIMEITKAIIRWQGRRGLHQAV